MTNAVREMYPYLCVPSVDDAIDFYERAFGAREHFVLREPGGRVGHAELHLGATILMLSDPFPELGVAPPGEAGCASVSIHLHVEDVDALVADARSAGAQVLRAPEDQFYGERSATVLDPFGYRWLLGHTIEDVSTEEMQRRYAALMEPVT